VGRTTQNQSVVVLFRQSFHAGAESTAAEFEAVQKYFDVVEHRSEISSGSLVIGRYSVLPFYKELEWDLNFLRNSILINDYRQHKWIADFDYYEVVKDFTPKTWTDSDFYLAPEGAFVLKGRTNSRKHQWRTHMFAATKREAAGVARLLVGDSLIGPQGILYRRYVPLRTFEVGINDQPFTNEWRFFYYKTTRLSYGYYWTGLREDLLEDIRKQPGDYLPQHALDFADKVAAIAAEHVNFFVLDIGETAEGDWILIEVNDGQMSGLSENDPAMLYRNLSRVLKPG
jgi:hypothetical protein